MVDEIGLRAKLDFRLAATLQAVADEALERGQSPLEVMVMFVNFAAYVAKGGSLSRDLVVRAVGNLCSDVVPGVWVECAEAHGLPYEVRSDGVVVLSERTGCRAQVDLGGNHRVGRVWFFEKGSSVSVVVARMESIARELLVLYAKSLLPYVSPKELDPNFLRAQAAGVVTLGAPALLCSGVGWAVLPREEGSDA